VRAPDTLAAVAVSAQPKPLTLPLPGGSPGATVRVHPMRCGEILIPPRALDPPSGRAVQLRVGLSARRSRWTPIPVPVFLVEHPTAGRLLIDTGFHRSVQDDARTSLGRRGAWIRPARQASGESAPEQLRARGVEPDEVAVIVMTHLHNDHASGTTQFPHATFVVDGEEWQAACEGGFAEGYRHEHFDQPFDWRTISYGDGVPHAGFPRTLDLFGDGSVRLLSTRGHTRGHQSVLLALRGGELLLTADAAYTRRSIDEDLVPIFVFGDAGDYRESLGRIREFAGARPDAVVIPGHDALLWPQLEPVYA
jgi:N-acyl homoserine lactone hydrolase